MQESDIVWIKVIIVLIFIGIVVSLASSLFYLVNDKGDSRRTLRALTVRIGLSVGLFAFLMILVGLDVIEPHGVYPQPPSAAAPKD
jgi:NADH:ubiquinone oxidoreductase subunit 6 (subunit J)